MATTTTNLGLTKPSGTDKIRIAQINGNMDILDDKIGAVGNTSLQAQVTSANQAIANNEGAMAYIVGNTNTTSATIEVGQFVYVKGHSTIAEGLRKVTASISANASITTSNTDVCSGGGFNELNRNINDFIYPTVTGVQDVNLITNRVYEHMGLLYVNAWIIVQDSSLQAKSTKLVNFANVSPKNEARVISPDENGAPGYFTVKNDGIYVDNNYALPSINGKGYRITAILA